MSQPIDWGALDYDDPCALLAALRPAYYKLFAGESEVSVSFRGRQTQFRQASSKELGAKIAELENACAAKQGVRRRFAKGIRHI